MVVFIIYKHIISLLNLPRNFINKNNNNKKEQKKKKTLSLTVSQSSTWY